MFVLNRKHLLCVVVVVAVLLPDTTTAHRYGEERIEMKAIKALTLRKGKMTGGSKPVKQLECVGGSARGMWEPEVVQCTNQGWDGREVQWECSATMSRDYSFGEITVTCEGWDRPGDKFVVVGSCGLEYKLDLTETGRRNRGENTRFTSDYARGGRSDGYASSQSSGGTSSVVVFMGVAIAFYMLYKCSTSRNNGVPNGPPPPYREGRDGGGGYGGDNGGGGFGSGFGGGGFGSGFGSSSRRSRRARNNGPGFWSGMAAGGLMGSLFGGRNRGYGSGYGSGVGYNGGGFRSRRSGWGGWGSSAGGWGSSAGSSWGSSSSSSSARAGSSSSSSGSSDSYTSRGFGGSRSR